MKFTDIFKINVKGKAEEGTLKAEVEVYPKKTEKEIFDAAVKEVIAEKHKEAIKEALFRYLAGDETVDDTHKAIKKYGITVYHQDMKNVLEEFPNVDYESHSLSYDYPKYKLGLSYKNYGLARLIDKIGDDF